MGGGIEESSEKEETQTPQDTQTETEPLLEADLEALAASEISAAEAEGSFQPVESDGREEHFQDYTEYMASHSISVDGVTVGADPVDAGRGFRLVLTFELDREEMERKGTQYRYAFPQALGIGDAGSREIPLELRSVRGRTVASYYIRDNVLWLTFPGIYDRVCTKFVLEGSWEVQEGSAGVSLPWRQETQEVRFLAEEETESETPSYQDGNEYLAAATYMMNGEEIGEADLASTLEGFQLALRFDFSAEAAENRGLCYQYALPEEIRAIDAGSPEAPLPLLDEAGKEIGSYYVSGNVLYFAMSGSGVSTVCLTLDVVWDSGLEADLASLMGAEVTMAEAEELMALSADGAEEEWTDFTPYLTSHTIRVDGRDLESGDTINPKKEFQLSLMFEMKIADMAKGGLKYRYAIPEHLSIGDVGSEEAQRNLCNASGTVIGTYFIRDDVIYITFPGYYVSLYVRFSQGGSWDLEGNEAEFPVNWGKSTQLFKVDFCDLAVSKTSSGFRTEEDGSLINVFSVKVVTVGEDGSVPDFTLVDTLTSETLGIYEDYYGENQDIQLTGYSAEGKKQSVTYYDAEEVCQTEKGKTVMTLDKLSLEEGGYCVVEYACGLAAEERIELDTKGGSASYSNSVTASYEGVSPDTGEPMTLSKSSSISGTYQQKSEWVMKKMGDPVETTLQETTVYIVPYTLDINKDRAYSLGGSVVHDAITGFNVEAGAENADVRYRTDGEAENFILWSDADSRNNRVDQTWVILESGLYQEFLALTARAGSDTALERLRADSGLASRLVAAVNA